MNRNIRFLAGCHNPHRAIGSILDVVLSQAPHVDVGEAGVNAEQKHISDYDQPFIRKLAAGNPVYLLLRQESAIGLLEVDFIVGEGIGSRPTVVKGEIKHRAEVFNEPRRSVVGRRVLVSVVEVEPFYETVVYVRQRKIIHAILSRHKLRDPLPCENIALVGASGYRLAQNKLVVILDELVANVEELDALLIEVENGLFDFCRRNHRATQDHLVIARDDQRPVVVQHRVDVFLLFREVQGATVAEFQRSGKMRNFVEK